MRSGTLRGSPKPRVAVDALNDLEEHARAQHLGEEVQELALLVTVVQDRVLAQARDQFGRQRKAGIEVVVVVAGHLQNRCAALTHDLRARDRIVGGEGNELRARHAGRPVASTQRSGAQRDSHAIARIARGPAADEPEGRGDLARLARNEAEHRPEEQRRLVEVVDRLGDRHMIDHREQRGGIGRRAGRAEVLEPALIVVGVAEEESCAVRRGDRIQVGLIGAAGPGKLRCQQPISSAHRPGRVGAFDGQRTDRSGGRSDRSLWREIEQDPGAALFPQLHRLGAMLPDVGETEVRESARDEGSRHRVDGELGEREPAEIGGGRQVGGGE